MKNLKLILSTVFIIVVTALCVISINPETVEASIEPDYEMINYRCPTTGQNVDRCNHGGDECDVSAQEFCN